MPVMGGGGIFEEKIEQGRNVFAKVTYTALEITVSLMRYWGKPHFKDSLMTEYLRSRVRCVGADTATPS